MGALGSVLGGLGGPRGPEEPRAREPVWPEANNLNPPRRKYALWDPTPRVNSTTSQGQGNEEKRTYGTWRALWNIMEERDDGRMDERAPTHAQRPRGPADI